MLYEAIHSVNHLSSLSLIRITGDKAEEFLQGQVTLDVTKVDNKASLGALCNHQGRVLAIFYLFKKDNAFYCVVDASLSALFIQHLTKFAVFSKVILEDITQHYFIYGCHEFEGLKNLTMAKNFPVEPNDVVHQDSFTICNFPGAETRYLIVSMVDHSEMARKDDMKWRRTNIQSGIATIYPETSGATTPHMLNLPKLGAVSFSKGCYVGQEIIARTHYLGKSKRHLCQATIPEPITLQPGQPVKVGKDEVGLVIDSVVFNGKTELLAVIQEPLERDLEVAGRNLEIASPA